MPIFQVTPTELKALTKTTFGAEGILERKDLQRLLRERISTLADVLDDRFMVIDEEFGDWVESTRRVDLLCIDGEANLVVVELKRTDDGATWSCRPCATRQ
jgi:RecB family endonuclease NucS